MTSKKVRTVIGRILLIIFTTLLLLVLAVVGTVFVILRGPSRDAQELLTRSLKETSAIGFIPDLFLSSERIEEILRAGEEPAESGGATDARLVTISATKRTPSGQQGGAEAAAKEPGRMLSEGIWLVDITGPNYRGVLMIVEDPTRVFVGTPEHLGDSGSTLEEMVAYYDAIAGINAGGFYDPGGTGNGGIPDGIVIANGELAWGHPGTVSNVIGFDGTGILHVGTMSAQEALDRDIRWACTFTPSLIINGQPEHSWQVTDGSVNPRTAIGQRADGAVLLLVIDGRHISSIGATYEDLIRILLEYGAINASNLDGGSSSKMIYEGEALNENASVIGSRGLPTSFLVRR
jgi:exopolysaccharide biosynthesis protein